jgi:hypothetical protein
MPDAPRQADSDASLTERVEALERSGEGLHERFDALEGRGFFKFSVEQGWMRPAVRVGSGTAFGALLGALGTQGAPFLLYTASGSVPGLVGYTGLVLAGGAAVLLLRGVARAALQRRRRRVGNVCVCLLQPAGARGTRPAGHSGPDGAPGRNRLRVALVLGRAGIA